MKLLHLLAGGAVLTTIAAAAAPKLLEKGVEKLRKKLEQYEFDPTTGTVRFKDENVVLLDEADYHVHETTDHQ